jgi:hypothetical protein
MKRFIFLALFWAPGLAFAGPERAVTSDPTFEDYGNSWRPINVAANTSSVVLISSTPANSGLGIAKWRFREIVNTSNGSLTLFPNNTSYSAFSSTYSIVLASGTSGMGDSWKVPGDGAVYGIWASGTNSGGAGGSEHYWK